MEQWDPIGVNDTPEAADEYDIYIGGIYRLLEQGASKDEFFAHLRDIEIGRMELIDEAGAPLVPEGKRNAAVAARMALRGSFANPA